MNAMMRACSSVRLVNSLKMTLLMLPGSGEGARGCMTGSEVATNSRNLESILTTVFTVWLSGIDWIS